MPESLEDVCRLCLTKDRFMLPIFTNRKSSPNFSFRFKLMTCADIQVFADDGLHPKVCHKCYHQVEKSYEFRNMCEKSNCVQLPGERCLMNTTDQRIHCFDCNKSFKTVLDSVRHVQIEHALSEAFVCTLCTIAYPDLDQFILHSMDTHRELNQCDKCDQVFMNDTNLEAHKHTHIAVQCKYCKYVFDDESVLRSHEADHLERVCQYCCQEFPSKQQCNEHTARCTQPHTCKFCNQGFTQRKDLIEHVTTVHENAVKHGCSECNKEFDKWDQFQDHTCDVNEDSLHCNRCNLYFTDLSLLESHMFAHNTHVVCKFCSKKFSLKSSLRRHEKTHTGQKPYQCTYCPRKFKDNSTCVVHMRTHTGEQPFECHVCHKHFRQLANLKMHTYRHHKKGNKVKMESKEIPEHGQVFVQQQQQQHTQHETATQLYTTEEVLHAVNEYTSDQNRVYHVLDMNLSGFDPSVPL